MHNLPLKHTDTEKTGKNPHTRTRYEGGEQMKAKKTQEENKRAHNEYNKKWAKDGKRHGDL